MNRNGWIGAAAAATLALCLTACGVKITGISLPERSALEAGASQVLAVEYTAGQEVAGEKLDQAAQKLALVWTSSDETVATVDAEGTVTAVAQGEADITAASEDGKLSANCHVTVGVGVTDLDAPKTLELQLGATQTARLDASVVPENATDVTLTYESSDEQVATVSADGTVTAVGEGECTIQIQAKGFGDTGTSAETKVTVLAAETEEETASGNGGKETTDGKTGTGSTGKTGSTASAGKTSSTGSTGNAASPAPTAAPAPAPTAAPAPAPAPTSAPAPAPTPAPAPAATCPTCGLPLQGGVTGNCLFGGNHPTPAPEGGAIGGNGNDIIPGGGTFDNDGGDAELVEPPIAPPPGDVTIYDPSTGITTDGEGNIISQTPVG